MVRTQLELFSLFIQFILQFSQLRSFSKLVNFMTTKLANLGFFVFWVKGQFFPQKNPNCYVKFVLTDYYTKFASLSNSWTNMANKALKSEFSEFKGKQNNLYPSKRWSRSNWEFLPSSSKMKPPVESQIELKPSPSIPNQNPRSIWERWETGKERTSKLKLPSSTLNPYWNPAPRFQIKAGNF